MGWIRNALATVAAFVVSGCATPPPDGLTVYENYDRPAHQADDPAKVVVKVSTARQRVYVMEESRLLLVMPVTVGAPATPTPHGDFRITEKDARHRASDHGFRHRGDRVEKSYRRETPGGWSFTGRPMPYWCGFEPGYGFHTGWVKHCPSSDGCSRMHRNLAPKFFQLVRVGTPVIIRETLPEDAKHANIPLPPDAGPLPDYPGTYYLGEGVFTDHLQPRFR